MNDLLAQSFNLIVCDGVTTPCTFAKLIELARNLINALVILSTFLATAAFAYAQAVKITLPPPFRGGSSLFALLRTIINDILLPIGGVLAVLAFIYSGFLYVTAQGNQTKLATAHKALLYTSVGTAVLLGSWVIAQVIENTINQLK